MLYRERTRPLTIHLIKIYRCLVSGCGRFFINRGPWLFLAAWLVLPVAAQAQNQALEGRVVDPQNAAIVGVTVTVDSPTITQPLVALTDGTGAYGFASIPLGVYRVKFASPGFQSQEHDAIVVRAGAVRVLSVQLQLSVLMQSVDVVAVAPVFTGGASADRIPSSVLIIRSDELEDHGAASLADVLNERLGIVSLEGSTANLFQPTLRFRGFTASPLLGLPQGIAVFQNGVRINEPFGDTVQFDLIPQFAVGTVQFTAGSEPAYGLNALGGALALRLKNGFDMQGIRGEISAGSFGRTTATAEYGANSGSWALYVGATRFDEDGWRTESPSEVTQAVVDVGYRRGSVNAGASFTYADTRLNGNGPAPVELIELDRKAVFTFPDTTKNRLAFGQGRFTVVVSPTWSASFLGYYRELDRQSLNGDEASFSLCDEEVASVAPERTLCMGDDDDETIESPVPDGDLNEEDEETEMFPIVDVVTGRFITIDDAAGDGALNRTVTHSKGYGGTFQLSSNADLFGYENHLVIGTSIDLADVAFSSNSEVGTLTLDRTVIGSGLFSGIFGEAPDDLFNTDIDTENRSTGVYFSDVLSLTDQLHVTVSGRFNDVRVEISDRLGSSLDGRHAFSRFNRALGGVYRFGPMASIFARYSESNRVPTAAELSCADPDEPCRVPNAFLSDPPLLQAVARSVEGGVRGRFGRDVGHVEWSLVAYRTRIRDDILFVASPKLIGTGFFQNAGDTQRLGFDVDLSGEFFDLAWFGSYSLLGATFESPLILPSDPEINSAAYEDGGLRVQAGDRIPGIPARSLKAGIRYTLTDMWHVSLETLVVSSRIFFGDEGNDQVELDGYGVASLRSSYRFTRNLEVFARVDNIFNVEYATFGALAEMEITLKEVPQASIPQFISPGTPVSGFAGLRVRF